MSLYLCVDCGGTKTAVALSDAGGTIVGRASGGPSNITYLPPETFIHNVKEAIIIALKNALPTTSDISLPPVGQNPLAAAWFGISGADSPAAIAKVAPHLSQLLGLELGPKLVIANDTHLLAAPIRVHHDVSSAVAVIAGTGSIAVGFQEVDGRIEELGRVGGWGWVLGDEGGGYDVGREALRQILLANDKASITGQSLPDSVLINRVLEKFKVDTVMEILTEVYHPDPMPGQGIDDAKEHRILNREKRISSLPPLVFEAAFDHKDAFALGILKAAAGHLASQIALLVEDRGGSMLPNIDPSRSVISFGGSLVGIEAYRQLILDDLSLRGSSFKRVIYIEDAAATGATSLAAAFSAQRA